MKIHELFDFDLASAKHVHHLENKSEVSSFVLTPAHAGYLKEILERLVHAKESQGVWITGFFGTGKTHFLDFFSGLWSSEHPSVNGELRILRDKARDKFPNLVLKTVQDSSEFKTPIQGLALFDEVWQFFLDKRELTSTLEPWISELPKGTFLILTSQAPLREFDGQLLKNFFSEIEFKGSSSTEVILAFLRKKHQGEDPYFPFSRNQILLLGDVLDVLRRVSLAPVPMNANPREIIATLQSVLWYHRDWEAQRLPFDSFYLHLKKWIDEDVHLTVKNPVYEVLLLTKYVHSFKATAKELASLLLMPEEEVQRELQKLSHSGLIEEEAHPHQYVLRSHYGKIRQALEQQT